MKRKSLTLSPIGALLSLASTYFYYEFALWLGPGSALLMPIFGILHMGLLYLLASRFSQSILGELMRGAMIGLNSGWNAWIIYYLTSSYYLSICLSIILLGSSILSISRKAYYHTFLGWINWLLPMSWPVNAPGLLIFILNLLFAPIGYLHPLLQPLRLRFQWNPYCSTLTLYGGLIRPFKGFAGLNMGNFIYINPGWQHLLKHEIGHLFSLAAMGSIFHYIGGIDENYLQKYYWKALAEHLAESYNESGNSVLSMWS